MTKITTAQRSESFKKIRGKFGNKFNQLELSPHFEEIYAYWKQNYFRMNRKEMWDNFVSKFFINNEDFDWRLMFTVTCCRKWEKKEKLSKPITDIERESLKQSNRDKALMLLDRKLQALYSNPDKFDNTEIEKIMRLYELIRREEDSEKNLELKAQKENRETALTFFQLAVQYGNIKQEDIENLRKLINEQKSKQFQLGTIPVAITTAGDIASGNGSVESCEK